MKTLVLRDIVKNSSSVEEGLILFGHLRRTYLNNSTILLVVDSEMSLSSSFLNSSVGAFLDDYGFSNFQNTVKFKGSKAQFHRFKKYLDNYNDLYLA